MTDQPITSEMQDQTEVAEYTQAERAVDETATEAVPAQADAGENAATDAGAETRPDAPAAPEAAENTAPAETGVNAADWDTADAAPSQESAAESATSTSPAAPVTPALSNENAPRSFDELRAGMGLNGRVKRVELYGAFVDIGIGTDGLLHISQLGRTVRNVEDVVKAGDQITVYVLRVDAEKRRIALSLVQPVGMSWEQIKIGDTVTGKIVKVEQYGAFVDIGAERPGMIHVSELAQGYVNSPSDVVKVGDEVQAKVIKVNAKQRRIDLSIKALQAPPVVEKSQMSTAQPEEDVPTAMALALRRAMQTSSDDLPPMEEMGRERSANRGRDKGRDRDRRQQRDLEDIFDRTLRGGRR